MAAATFSQPGASTMMACEEAVMTQATAFMAALTQTDSFTISEYAFRFLAVRSPSLRSNPPSDRHSLGSGELQ
ncbi:MAG: META domain-containing protein [Chloroflexi bacterium]|nr:META domain-containing protein [Chloroflexota bacterium]